MLALVVTERRELRVHAVRRSDYDSDREFVRHFAILNTPCGAPYVLAPSDLVWSLPGVTDCIVDGWRRESKSYLGLDAGLLGEYTHVGPSGRPVSGCGRL